MGDNTALKITMFSRSLPFHRIGGMENVCWDVATGLSAKGHSVTLATTQIPGPFPPTGSIKVVPLSGTKPGRYSRTWWALSREYYRTVCATDGTDIAISIGYGGFSVVHDRQVVGVPVIYQAHGAALGEAVSKLREGRLIKALAAGRDFVRVLGELSAHPRFDAVVAVSTHLEQTYRRFPYTVSSPARLLTIANGINLPDMGEVEQPEVLARLRGAKVILAFSRLHRQKGVHLTIEALQHLPGVHLVILGDGPEAHRLQQLVELLGLTDRVHLLGAVSRDEVAAYLRWVDASAFTTIRQEGLPLNVLEAMAAGVPLVLSERLYDVLQVSDKSLLYVNPLDSHRLAEAMEEALSLPKASSLASLAQLHFSKQHMVDRYEALMMELVALRTQK